MALRQQRVASLIKEEISMILQRNFRIEEHGLITVTAVEMTKDLKAAKVFVSVMGDTEQKATRMKALERHSPSVREALGRVVRLRHTPSVIFMLDETLDHAMKIESILRQIKQEKELKQQHEGISGTDD
jgi:ribosome-binding factor A